MSQAVSQGTYSDLLSVIEEMGREIRPTYAGSKSAMERLKRGEQKSHARAQKRRPPAPRLTPVLYRCRYHPRQGSRERMPRRNRTQRTHVTAPPLCTLSITFHFLYIYEQIKFLLLTESGVCDGRAGVPRNGGIHPVRSEVAATSL